MLMGVELAELVVLAREARSRADYLFEVYLVLDSYLGARTSSTSKARRGRSN